ncbi:ABC transporter permease [Hymenobacter crusticola]|uniref:ABC transporter permease n=1 Tax=Hymenobacter crusticola TaxID=1770526 RepID=UPI0015C4F07C|nr:ABC transporter permease [Hymenobacter crusticola]
MLLVAALADWLPLPYAPGDSDLTHLSEPPFTALAASRHWLGTDPLGRDLLAGLVFGARTTLIISIPAALLAVGVGILLGSAAGFWGNTSLRVSLGHCFGVGGLLLTGFLSIFRLWPAPELAWPLTATSFALVSLLATRHVELLQRVTLTFPVDQLVMSAIALLESIPRLILVLVIASVQESSVFTLLLVLSLTYWTGPARLIRAEVMRIRALPYIEAVRATGLTNMSILIYHVLPNASRSVRTAFPLSIAALIGLETTLSFLGIGLPTEIASWGRLMATARLDSAAWWLIVEPGLLLLGTMLALRQLARPDEHTGK